MASYKVTLFKNTGLNGVNTVDNISVLNNATHFTVPDVELMQDRNLGHIDVEATFTQCEDCDYCIVGSECYSIPEGGINAKTEAVTEITLLSDPFLSAGGITVSDSGAVTARFDILDGVTSRCTVKDDSWGAYTTEDPLTAPQEPLRIQTEWLNSESSTTDHVLTETTIDLIATMGQGSGVTYTDDDTKETVTVPETIPALDFTSYSIDGTQIQSAYTKVYDRTDGTQVDGAVGTAKDNISSGLQYINALGVAQGSVLNQWKVPSKFATETKSNMGVTVGTTAVEYTDQRVADIAGVSGNLSSGISPDYATVKNKRVLYGDYNKYGMITCAGNSAEFKPEDLENGTETAPSISYKADPRPKGKPYYRFTVINGDTEFWRNALPGSEWENVPLVYQGASGSALTRLNFDNERAMKSLQADQYKENFQFTMFNDSMQGIEKTLGAAIAGGAVGGVPGAIAGGVSTGIMQGVNIAQDMTGYDQYFERYNQQKANELSGLYQATTVYAPTVNFPYNADILRDVKGNGVLIYKYRMSANDAKRVDKLLTMYGYRTAEPLTLANFGRRKHFDYVACSTISITGLPKWRCDAIAQQLKVGVRIWHELPNTDAYDDNPVRS